MLKKNIFFFVLFFFGVTHIAGQQNNVLFFMHQVPQSNFVNPAVQNECKWFIGLPVISSVHFNYGNTGFSYMDMVRADGDMARLDIDHLLRKLKRRNYMGTELHVSLLSLGYKRNEYYFTFNITEKNNTGITYPKEMASLLWRGNSQFEGESAGFRGTGFFFNHYREFALGISKKTENGNYAGVRGKLLFGKLNVYTKQLDIDLFTDANTYNLTFTGEMDFRTSLPLTITEVDGVIDYMEMNNPDLMQLLFNRRNWGVAFDAGFIHHYDDKITLSGSILDVGMIGWRSNQNSIEGSGNFFYDGPLGDSLDTENYLQDLMQAFADSLEVGTSNDNYTTPLFPRYYLGGTYQLNPKLKAGVLVSGQIHKYKFMKALTLSGYYNPYRSIHVSASYSLINGSFNNIGAGFSIGRNPVQVYVVSDNIMGMILPLRTRNINLRFGLNIILGCDQEEEATSKHGSLDGMCPWLEKEQRRRERKAKWKK